MNILQWFKKKIGIAVSVVTQAQFEAIFRRRRNLRVVELKDVEAATAILEAADAMAENIPDDIEVLISMKAVELSSFVAYMRALDKAYRRGVKQLEEYQGREKARYEREEAQKTAQAIANSNRWFTRESPSLFFSVLDENKRDPGSERSSINSGNVPVAEKAGKSA